MQQATCTGFASSRASEQSSLKPGQGGESFPPTIHPLSRCKIPTAPSARAEIRGNAAHTGQSLPTPGEKRTAKNQHLLDLLPCPSQPNPTGSSKDPSRSMDTAFGNSRDQHSGLQPCFRSMQAMKPPALQAPTPGIPWGSWPWQGQRRTPEHCAVAGK